ncbi:energy-coupling factor transporter transmembrane component T family protein [Seleniivibrio woodruffii]|uniref:energy-coupling factor transporter transmembrane component T family protein n=1 Tax=Seleniivibrio woodruffii TaxID=1078050 RepID=UPI00240A6DAB|nr:energy-coupling factor transporter transmembrane component T [Seleniivibrio woodruffii]
MRFSPAAGILCAVIYSFVIAFKQSITPFDAVFAAGIMALRWNCLPKYALRIAKLNLMIIFISATVYIFGQDSAHALLIFIRYNLIVCVTAAMFCGMNATDFYYGFYTLKLPHKFTVLLFFAVKYIEIIGNEYEKMRTSLRIRNFKPRTDRFTYRTLAYLLGMLLVRSMDRANALTEAMKMRGFAGRLYPFNFRPFFPADVAAVALLVFQIFLTYGVTR